jgi:hypothetical protein
MLYNKAGISNLMFKVLYRITGYLLMKLYRNIGTLVSAALLVVGSLTSGSVLAETITMHQLSAAPRVDGSSADWNGVGNTTVKLRKTLPNGKSDVRSVSVKGGVFGDEVYFLLQWKDSTADKQHKPFIWDAGKNKYVGGKQREDRMAIQFAMEGDYTTDWASGNAFKADMWHWKAFRSNTLGLVHDKMTIIGVEPLKRAYKVAAENGRTLYIQRPSDAGTKLYTTKRYSKKEQDTMPKYILADNPEGSVSDVKAKGVWRNGVWTVEIKRKLNTGHSDDVVFAKGKAVKGGIAIFNRTGDDDHTISDTLTFKF